MASEFNFKLLRRGAIYRISYAAWHTQMSPISFILYPGSLKVHALVLNAPSMSAAEQMIFARFIKKMSVIPGIENYSGRILYRILRMYYPNIVRKAYRTYFTSLITKQSLVSYGIVPQKLFTDLEFKISDKTLFKQASKTSLMQIITTFTGTQIKDVNLGMAQTLPFAKPVVTAPQKQNPEEQNQPAENKPKIPTAPTTPQIPQQATKTESNNQPTNNNINQPGNNNPNNNSPGGLEGYD